MRFRINIKANSGFVLVVVLCMVVMLGILLFGFNHKSRAGLLAVDDMRKSRQALNSARSGLNIAIAAIRDEADIKANRKLSNLLSGEESVSLNEGQCSITVTEESGRLNINLLVDENGQINRTMIDRLLRLIDLMNRKNFGDFNISYGLIPSIIDWIDSDDKVTFLPFVKHDNSGVESDYYMNLIPSYRCRNKPFEVTEELLLVKGVTQQVFDSLKDYITVRGDEQVNINWASKYVIQSLSENMDPVLAQMIVDHRKIKPFGSVEELRDIPGMTDSIYQSVRRFVTVRPAKQYYRIESEGTVDGLSYKTFAVVQRNVDNKKIDVILYKEL
jgi:general secretion pathway protein K